MKKILLTLLAATLFLPAISQNVEFSDHQGRVVDATTGKPLPNVKVTHAIGGQSDAQGRFTVRYYKNDIDQRVVVSHPGYCSDTFSYAPTFVSLRRVTAHSQKGRPTVAVVLSGGGAKGVAHISALRAIEEVGIPIDIICGTSMGSLIGALYCIGYTTDELDSLVRSQDWTFLLSDRTDPTALTLRQREEQNTYAIIRGLSSATPEKGGLIRGRNLDRLFRTLCAGYLDSMSFDSLPIRFACVATDIVTNTEVDFHSGYLIQAMRASMAIPAAFTPVRMGEQVLIDGGLRNNYPADVARRMGADIIIGVTVQGDSLRADDITDAMSVFNQIIDINCKNKYDENVAMSDVMMKVDVSGYSAASFTPSAIDVLICRGAEEALRNHDDLMALKSRIFGTAGATPTAAINTSQRYTPRPAIDAHRGMVDDTTSGNTKQLPIEDDKPKKADPIVSVGFRFDTEEMGALQIGVKLPFGVSWLPMELDATLRLGKRIMAGVEYSIFTRRIFSPVISYTFFNDDLNIYLFGLRTYNVKYRHHQGDFTPINFELKKWQIQAGVRWDYYDYYGRVLSIGTDSLLLNDDHYLTYRFSADLNTEDHWYFPAHGMRFHAAYAYRTDNLLGMDGGIGLSDIEFNMRGNIPLASRLTLQPMVYTRLLAGADAPAAYSNTLGSEWFGHCLEQQIPFAGIGHIELMERYLMGGQLQLQYRIKRNHFILLRFAVARHNDDFRQLIWPVENADEELPVAWRAPMMGGQIGYSYNTLIGPVDVRLGYSNRTRMVYFFINLGHRF